MCWTTSQILAVIGLVIQFISVLYQARKLHLFKSYKEKKEKEIEELGKDIYTQITERERDWLVTLVLIFIGLVLQGLAEFVR